MSLPSEKEESQDQIVKGHGYPPTDVSLTVDGPKGVFNLI